MTATNHALTGAAIGLVIGEPLLAVPAALVSHFVCDALPHYSSSLPDEVVLKSKAFRNYLVGEASLCLFLVICLALFKPDHWLLAASCAFLAAAPDLVSVNRYLAVRRGQPFRPGRYVRFARRIQWFERPIGGVVEIAWFIAMLLIIVPFIR